MKLFPHYQNDDVIFIKHIEAILQNRLKFWQPDELYITRIDNWFDVKWLEFSGNILGALSIWKAHTTIPPFHPNRVVFTNYYIKQDKTYISRKIKKPLHILKNSSNNLQRNITDFSKNGLFVWYSGNSKKNNIGSVMMYLIIDGECFSFYFSLDGNKNWNVGKIMGISRRIIQDVINRLLQ